MQWIQGIEKMDHACISMKDTLRKTRCPHRQASSIHHKERTGRLTTRFRIRRKSELEGSLNVTSVQLLILGKKSDLGDE